MKKIFSIFLIASLCSVILIPRSYATDFTANLSSCWTMDEASGARADSYGSNNLTDSNTVTSQTGKISTTAEFTAANSEELYKLDTASLEPGSAFTFQAWVYQKTNIAGSRTIFSKWGGPGPILHTAGSGDELKLFHTGSGSDYAITSGLGMSANTWYHVALVYDGSGSTNADKVKLYVNGTSQTLSFVGTDFATSFADTGASFEIGNWATLSYYWNGYIDEAAFWQRALSSSEVTALYNSGNGLSCATIGTAGGGGSPAPARRRSPSPIKVGQ